MKRIFKYGIIISTAYAMVRMWHWKIGFTYFTQLSNLLIAFVVLGQLVSGDDRRLKGAKFSAVVSITVTFLVFLTVLAPVMPGGILAAYLQDHGASLCMHFLTPALSAADFFVSDSAYPWQKKHVFGALIPPAAYLFLVLFLGAAGLRWGGGSMAGPYAFLNYEAPAGWFGFMPETAGYNTTGIGVFYAILVLMLVFLLLGAALLSAAGRFGKRTPKKQRDRNKR